MDTHDFQRHRFNPIRWTTAAIIGAFALMLTACGEQTGEQQQGSADQVQPDTTNQ